MKECIIVFLMGVQPLIWFIVYCLLQKWAIVHNSEPGLFIACAIAFIISEITLMNISCDKD